MYFEDFVIDEEKITPSRKVTAEDLDAFIRLSGLDNPIFNSEGGAREMGHRGRLVPAPFQLSLAMGLCQQAGLFDRVVAVLEFENLRFLRPVHPGATLKVRARAVEKRPTSRPERGLVVLDYDLLDQDGQAVMSARAKYLMRQKDPAVA